MSISRRVKVGLLATAVAGAVAVPAIAQADTDGSSVTTRTGVASGAVKVVADIGFEPTEEIEYFNEMADDLAAHLTEQGIDHTVQTGEVRWVEWDIADETANAAVENFLADADFFEFDDLDEEDIAEIQAEADAIRQALDEAGIAYTLETDPLGIEWPLFDEENEAAWEAVDEAFTKLFEQELAELSDEEIAELRSDVQAEADAIRQALDEAGIAYTLESDPLGVEFPVFDEEDEAAWDAIDQVFEDLWEQELAELSDEERAELTEELTAEATALREALDEAGIDYTVETDSLGVEWPVFDEENEEAWELLDDLFMEHMEEEFTDGFFFDEDFGFFDTGVVTVPSA